MIKKVFLSVLVLFLCCAACAGAADTVVYVDSTGREVEIPAAIERVASSGPMTQVALLTIAPERMVNISSEMPEIVAKYMPDYIPALPGLGQFYGKASNLNLEGLIVADPQIIVDLGDLRDSTAGDMDGIQAQTGVPTVFIEARIESFGETYRALGALLGKEEEAEALARYCDETWREIAEKAATIPEDERLRVYYGIGENGLTTTHSGATHSLVINTIGAVNVIGDDGNMASTVEVSLENIIAGDPDVILFAAEGDPYTLIPGDAAWASLRAVQAGEIYEIPEGPYSWFGTPPSINRLLGLKWLGNLLYPEIYDYDMVAEVQAFYALFYHYDLSEAEARALMGRSTYRAAE